MDFVTHAAVGALVGRVTAPSALTPSGARRYALAGALIAVSPDADHVLEWLGAESYLLHHRGPSHSLALVLAATVVVRLWGRAPRARHAALVAAALLSHLALDVLTPYGTALFWPLSDEWVALDVLPIVCPWLTALALVAAIAGAALSHGRVRWPRRLAGLGLAAIAAFVGVEAVVAGRARAAVRREAGLVSRGLDSPELRGGPHGIHHPVLAVPSWSGPLSATASFASPVEPVYERWTVPAGGPVRRVSTRPMFTEKGVRASKQSEDAVLDLVRPVRAWRRFRLPVFDVSEREVVVSDLQFDLVEEGLRPIEVVVPRDGGAPRVRQMHLGVQPVLYLLVVVLAWAVSRRPSRWL